ncbi:MAG: hypothetical protein JTT11_05895 [Candidatus Brockarchaeota archaeon]|nr:hypothetical protein [Candidatus Brockarchaeota archaeon]
MPRLSVGRFQVMATLQAARAYVLGMSLDLAKSWGLNRAIFYAAAKRGFKEKAVQARSGEDVSKKPVEEKPNAFFLGDEMAYKTKRARRTCFTIGGEAQTEEAYKRQIEARFGERYEEAWREALSLVKAFPKETLLSQREFYELVYKPVRDELASKWSKLAAGAI